MPRIQLRTYRNPGQVEVFVNIKLTNGYHRLITATIDTGAEVSLFPTALLNVIEYRLVRPEKVVVQQAGLANQQFEAYEAMLTIYLEDLAGNQTQEFEIRAWFTETEESLIGFDGILDRARLHIDMLSALDAWLEIAT